MARNVTNNNTVRADSLAAHNHLQTNMGPVLRRMYFVEYPGNLFVRAAHICEVHLVTVCRRQHVTIGVVYLLHQKNGEARSNLSARFMRCCWQTGYHERGNMTRLTRMRGRPKRSYRRASSLNFGFSSASEPTVTSCFGHCAKGEISKLASTNKLRAQIKDDTSILDQSVIFLFLENEPFLLFARLPDPLSPPHRSYTSVYSTRNSNAHPLTQRTTTTTMNKKGVLAKPSHLQHNLVVLVHQGVYTVEHLTVVNSDRLDQLEPGK